MRWKTYTTSGLALGLLGCSMNPTLVAADDCGTSTDWWAVDDCGDAASTAGIVENGNADEGAEDDDEDLEDEPEDGTFTEIYGDLLFSGDTVSEGYIGYVDLQQGSVNCETEQGFTSVTTDGSCEACERAWRATVDEGWSEGSACAAAGWPLAGGSVIKIGHSGSQLYLDLGNGWNALGEFEAEGTEAFFSVWQGEDE